MHDSGTGAAGWYQTLERSDCADWVPMIDVFLRSRTG
jgi:hypothetical protein